MSRYFTKAFLIPWNLLAVAAIGVGGFFEPMVWYAGGAAEALYLAAVGSSGWLRRRVQAADGSDLSTDTADSRRTMLNSLGGAARQRYVRLEESRQKVERLYAESGRDDFLFESNRDALKRLSWLYLRLLVAQRNLVVSSSRVTEKDLAAEAETLRRQLTEGSESEALQRSRQARLEILEQRRDNVERREQSLAEIESDLARIEAQMALALEQAAIQEHPIAISTNVDLVSHILDGAVRATPAADVTNEPATPVQREPQ
jgi:hypothetical protein